MKEFIVQVAVRLFGKIRWWIFEDSDDRRDSDHEISDMCPNIGLQATQGFGTS